LYCVFKIHYKLLKIALLQTVFIINFYLILSPFGEYSACHRRNTYLRIVLSAEEPGSAFFLSFSKSLLFRTPYFLIIVFFADNF
jgi:hypothetical protein